MMDLPKLRRTIADALQDGTFSLAAADLDSPPVETLLATLLRQPVLELGGASVDTSGDRPSAQGTLLSVPQPGYGFLAGMQVKATYSLDGAGTPQLRLTLTPPPDRVANWGLPDALPGYRNSFFSAFAWANARFDYDTQAASALPADFPAAYDFPANSGAVLASLQKGMSFQADLTYKGQDAGLVWLLGGTSMHVAGVVEWAGGLPRMDLATGTLTTLNLAGFTLPISLHLVALLSEIPAADAARATLSSVPLGVLSGELERPINDSQTLTIPFNVELYQEPVRQVTVEGNFRSASSLALGEVGRLLGVAGLESQQAGDFPQLSGLSLQTLSLTLDAARRQLITAAATVAFTPAGGHWRPFGDVLSFDGFAVTFAALGPLSAPTFETVIAARATLAGGQLEASVTLPALGFACELAGGSPPIDLTEILNEITGGAFGSSFKLLCTQLRVLGNVSQNFYRFQATVQDDWTFSVLGANFALSSVGFDLTRRSGPGASTTGQVVAQLLVAGAQVQISAAYQGAQQGWSFSGGTLGPQNISLTALVSDVLSMFGLRLPASAPQVSITDLQMTLQTGSMDFGFSCDGRITMLGTTVEIGVDVGRVHPDPNSTSATTVFKGYLTIGPSTFEVDFSSAPRGKSFLFKWTDTTEPLTFEHIAGFFGYDMPALPENLDLSLTAAEFYYDAAADTVALSATSKNYGQILFVSFVPAPPSPNQGRPVYLFELDVPLNVELSDLPVVGDRLPAGQALGIRDLQVIVSSAALPAATDMKTLNDIIQTLGDSPLLPTSINSGLTFAAELQVGTGQQPIVLPLTGGASPPPATTTGTPAPALTPGTNAPAPGTSGSQGAATWFNIERSFGPVQFKRIGVQYQNSTLFFLLDASLSFAVLRLGLDGLGLGSPLTKFAPVPHLDGISVSLSSPPVTISGGLLAVPPGSLPRGVDYEYLGTVTISVEPYLIDGVASYARVDGQPSFFLFAQVTGSFGGPPAFFITGFMGGFGYNSLLAVPRPEQVYLFPFVAGLDDPRVFGPSPTPLTVLNVLTGVGGGKPAGAGGGTTPPAGSVAWVKPATGAYWVAAGLMFRSFELVIGHALLVATFGRELEIALLGLAQMSLPKGAPPAETYAYVELQLEALFKPADGFFGIFASLTPNSYVLTRACRLTGGFAFCLWFDPSPQAGDFVVTVGGYHPAFTPPPWYPQVARVGFNWPVDSKVTVKGGAYFALTPTAVMAGGSLEVLYQSGNLRAWFTAYANLLVRWSPFQFQVSIGISVGASYRMSLGFTTTTLTAELGATLDLWGPPTGGVANVYWYVISFSVPFGSSQAAAAATRLNWAGVEKLLPSDPAAPSAPAVLGVQINRGLGRQDSQTAAWVVRGDEFRFTTQTAVPASHITLAPAPADLTARDAEGGVSGGGINIRPMELSGVRSVHAVTVRNLDDGTVCDLSAWDTVTQSRKLPEALWGTPLGGRLPPASANLVSAQTGVQLTAPPARPGRTRGPLAIALLEAEPLPGGPMPLRTATQADPTRAPTRDPDIVETLGKTLAGAQAQQAQQALVAALAAFQAAPPTSALLTELAAQAGAVFSPPGPLRAVPTSPLPNPDAPKEPS